MASYIGLYNGKLLRSSLEYIFAKILEKENKIYDTETTTFIISDGKSYTPDFFIYDDNNELVEIVEIRAERLFLEKRKQTIKEVKDIYNVNITLLTEKELYKLCLDNGLNFTDLQKEWLIISEYNDVVGEKNPMFGKKHSNATKNLISEKAKTRWSDDEYANKCKLSFKNRDYSYLLGERVERIEKKCILCGKSYYGTEAELMKRQYCSIECSLKNTTEQAKKANMFNRENRHLEIKEIVVEWVKENEDVVKAIKMNRITPALKPLLDIIKEKTNIVDFRTITKATTGETISRKDFVLYLQNL